MEAANVCLLFLAVFFVVGVNPGESLKCYNCIYGGNEKTSVKECQDPKAYPDFMPEECNTTTLQVEKPFIYCRTMVQNVQGEKRIVRGCATDGRLDRCIERTGTKDIQVEYCECEGDGCNAASSLIASLLTFVAATLLALFVAS